MSDDFIQSFLDTRRNCVIAIVSCLSVMLYVSLSRGLLSNPQWCRAIQESVEVSAIQESVEVFGFGWKADECCFCVEIIER